MVLGIAECLHYVEGKGTSSLSSLPSGYLTMELEPALGDHYANIIHHLDHLRNAVPSNKRDKEIQQSKRKKGVLERENENLKIKNGDLERENENLKIKNGELQREIKNMEINSNSQRLRMNKIMNESILVTRQRDARENFRHGKDTTRKGPKVHSPVRDPQLKETASTPSSDISDGIVEHGVDSDSMQLTRNHQTQDTSSLRSLDRPRKHDLKRNVLYEKNHPDGSYLENIDQCS